MKPLRVLSPIEPGELCWVRVDGEWWLVRAEKRVGICEKCCFDKPLETCEYIPCIDFIYTRVHPIPTPVKGGFEKGGIYSDDTGVYTYDPEGYTDFTRIGPPEE